MNCQIFTTPKCERPYLLLKATSQSEFCFSLILIICSTVSGPEALKKVSAIFHIQFQWNVTEHFRNSIIQKHGVIVQKSLSETKYLEKKFADTFLFHVKLATIQIRGQTNKFHLTCSFQKRPKGWFGRSRFKVVKHSTVHFISTFLV